MLKTILLLVILAVFLNGCRTNQTAIGARDSEYLVTKEFDDDDANEVLKKNKNWLNGIVAIKTSENVYASGVIILYDEKEDITYIVTAKHVAQKGFDEVIHFGETFRIQERINHKFKDISLLKVKGELAPALLINQFIPDRDFDITVGYVGGHLSNKKAKEGKAVPGQSGGGVFSNKHGLYAIVSTTIDSVVIAPALKEMGFEWILLKNALGEQKTDNQG